MTKTNYVLIDYENLQPDMAEQLSSEVFRVLVFVGAAQTKVSIDMAAALQAKGDKVRYIRSAGAGKNALDFHIAFYLGQLATQEPDAYFHVITEDRGMDPLMHHLQSIGIRVSRSERFQDIPIVKADSGAAPDDKASIALAYLVARGAQRPATLKTLKGSVSALFTPRLDEAATAELLAELERNGVFAVDGVKIRYGLAD